MTAKQALRNCIQGVALTCFIVQMYLAAHEYLTNTANKEVVTKIPLQDRKLMSHGQELCQKINQPSDGASSLTPFLT